MQFGWTRPNPKKIRSPREMVVAEPCSSDDESVETQALSPDLPDTWAPVAVVARRSVSWRSRAAVIASFIAIAGVAWVTVSHGSAPSQESFKDQESQELWSPHVDGEPLDVKVLTYNTYWWNLFGKHGGKGGISGKLIAASSDPAFDFMGFQECKDPWRVLSDGGLIDEYTPIRGPKQLAMAYKKKSWHLLANGEAMVAKDQPGKMFFGKRYVQWMRLRHYSTDKTVLFVNHHGPLRVGSGGAWGGWQTAKNILSQISWHGQPGDIVIFVCDCNAGPWTPTLQGLKARLSHVYNGRSFGGIDNILSNIKSVVSTKNLGHGGSDHDALSAVIRVAAPTLASEKVSSAVRKKCTKINSDIRFAGEGWHHNQSNLSLNRCIEGCQQNKTCWAFNWKKTGEHAGSCWFHGGNPGQLVSAFAHVSGRVMKGGCRYHCHCEWANAGSCTRSDGSCCNNHCCRHFRNITATM